jgi:heavy metal translocating P-type ATPase
VSLDLQEQTSRPVLARSARLAVRYPVVSITLLVGIVSGILAWAGLTSVAAWIAGVFAMVVAVGYAVRMVRGIRVTGPGVDLLAITAIAATVLVGEEVAALVVVLMLSGGQALEDYANRRARKELDALLQREPRLAHRDTGEGVVDVPADEVRIGDVLLVRPAEVVPVDGDLVTDRATLDLSSITGESVPVEKHRGEGVLSGSINGAEATHIRATAKAADSQYQQIVALVAGASQTKAKVVRLADRFALPFTGFSLLLAGAAWLLSGSPLRFAEVLVLATPCPLLIAAPVAFIGGMSLAARKGIIVRSGAVFEGLAAVRTVVFDKTGTLTTGRPALREVRPADGFESDELLGLAASAEQYSSHVLAASVIQAASALSLELDAAQSAEEFATEGVLAEIGGRRVTVGSFRFVAARAPDATRASIGPGELAIYIAVDGTYAGALIERDTPRPNAVLTLQRLRELRIQNIELLTGDAEETAAGVAAELGIERYLSECLPADKVARVAAIAERPVIMVGDGVNDAPVLASADVGVAMGAKGATAASESADVVLLIDDISGVADAVTIARRTLRIAMQSIWLGIAASVVLMAIAAFGVIPATIGALLQEAVDLATILAALRAARPPRAPHNPRLRSATHAGISDPKAFGTFGPAATSAISLAEGMARHPHRNDQGAMQERRGYDAMTERGDGLTERNGDEMPDAAQQAMAGSIVVGHDGSAGASEALLLGLTLAKALKAPLLIVRSWSIDTAPKAPEDEFGYVSSFEEISRVVDEELRGDTRGLVQTQPGIEVGYRVELGQPAEVLIAVSERARMLVVGSRGRGGFASLLLGSVGEQCVHHALCPILVVPPHATPQMTHPA